MIIDENKMQAPLSKSILEQYNTLIQTIDTTCAKDLFIKKSDGTSGKINIANLIAYQIGWGTLLINWYEEGLKNKMPHMPGEGFTSWDYTAIAQHFYTKYGKLPIQDLLKQFEKIVNNIIQITEHEFATGNLDKLGVWDWCTLKSGKKWPLSKWIQINTVAPYKAAGMVIKKGLKETS